MTVKKFFAFGAVATVAAITPLVAAEAEVKANIDLPKTETRTEIKRDKDLTVRTELDRTAADREKVRHADKASGIIGMEVRNKENQKLGEIKDLVLDVHSGKVSYNVLAVGGFLGIREKLIALPPNALRVSDDQGYLILDADKSRIEAAPGFAATAWPGLHDPEIHNFWKSEASGAAAGSEIRRKTGADANVDVDRDHKQIKTEVNVDKKDKIYTDADKDKKVKVEVKKD